MSLPEGAIQSVSMCVGPERLQMTSKRGVHGWAWRPPSSRRRHTEMGYRHTNYTSILHSALGSGLSSVSWRPLTFWSSLRIHSIRTHAAIKGSTRTGRCR